MHAKTEHSCTSKVYLRCKQLTPPQPNILARSFPVPRGRTATGGKGLMLSLSKTDNTHPAVPSPPQAKIRMFEQFLNICNLDEEKIKITLKHTYMYMYR